MERSAIRDCPPHSACRSMRATCCCDVILRAAGSCHSGSAGAAVVREAGFTCSARGEEAAARAVRPLAAPEAAVAARLHFRKWHRFVERPQVITPSPLAHLFGQDEDAIGRPAAVGAVDRRGEVAVADPRPGPGVMRMGERLPQDRSRTATTAIRWSNALRPRECVPRLGSYEAPVGLR